MNARKMKGQRVTDTARGQAQCPLCRRIFDKPPARFSMLARCPVTKLGASSVQGPLFHSIDGHAFAVERFGQRPLPPTRWARFRSAVTGALHTFWTTLRQGRR